MVKNVSSTQYYIIHTTLIPFYYQWCAEKYTMR